MYERRNCIVIVLDYSANRLTGAAIASYRASGAIRYAGLPETNIKIINKAEADSIIAAGCSVALVFEQYATDAYGGYAQGVANATKLRNHAQSLGLPPRGFLCQDQWIASGQSTNVRDYFRGAISVLGAANTGIYGFSDTMDLTRDLGAGAYWQCGDPRVIRAWASVYQRNYGAYSVAGTAVDVNDILKPNWLQYPVLTPTIEENNMQVIECDQLGLIGILDGGRLRGIDAATANANPASLFPRFFVTQEVWENLVAESAKIDNLNTYFDALNIALAKGVTVHPSGSLSVSGTLNVQ
jgi:hypothetical protein